MQSRVLCHYYDLGRAWQSGDAKLDAAVERDPMTCNRGNWFTKQDLGLQHRFGNLKHGQGICGLAGQCRACNVRAGDIPATGHSADSTQMGPWCLATYGIVPTPACKQALYHADTVPSEAPRWTTVIHTGNAAVVSSYESRMDVALLLPVQPPALGAGGPLRLEIQIASRRQSQNFWQQIGGRPE
jgi:hypothetical protein